MRKIIATIIASGWVVLPASWAQPGNAVYAASDETVIVTAPRQRPDSVISNFVMTHAAPAPMLGKIARWKLGICPLTTGIAPGFASLVTARLRQIAAMTGAPVAANADCRVNIEIVFTAEPQVLLDNIRKERSQFLGFYARPQAQREAAMVSHVVQAWYATQTEDWNGMVRNDDPRTLGMDFTMPGNGSAGGMAVYGAALPDVHMTLPGARDEQVRGNRLGDGLSSELYHVFVVVDRTKVEGYEIGALADYIAMLALSQTSNFDICQDAPSITNLMAPGCDVDRKPNAITDFDVAFLRGLYAMDLAGNFMQERSGIVADMRKSLNGR